MDLSNHKILIVDDHSLMRRMVSTELRALGATNVEEAVDGDVGLQKIKAAKDEGTPYQIVFLDWTMPKLNGFDVLSACRADSALDHMAIVMLTSESEESNVLKALTTGATAYITKPFRPDNLAKKLEDVLSWRARRKDGAQ